MSTTSGRFSSAAAAAQQATPTGVSRREGWYRLTLIGCSALVMAVLWQGPQHTWGWIWLPLMMVWMVVQIHLGQRAADARRVLPLGFRRQWGLAQGWNLLVIMVPGWFWLVACLASPWWLTTTTALLGAAPMVWVASRLVREGR